jgi:hypothetical protein
MSTRPTRHGLTALMRRVHARGLGALDARSSAVRAVNAWTAALVNDLGGASNISTQKATLIDAAARTQLFLSHIDCYLLEQGSLVNRRKRSLWPVVRERQALVDSLARLLGQLGLERVARPVPTLKEYLDSKEQSTDEPEEEEQS